MEKQRLKEYLVKYYGSKNVTDELVDDFLKIHKQLNTYISLKDLHGNVYGFVRWNIVNDDTAEILDLWIDPRHEYGFKVIKSMLKEGHRRFPHIKYLRWERMYTHRNQEKATTKKVYEIQKLIKEK